MSVHRTTTVERGLLLGSALLLPLDNLLSVGGFSVPFVAFTILASYCFLFRARQLARAILQPPFLAAYVLLGTALVVETFHFNASYIDVIRIAQMIGGAILIATLCRDQPAINSIVFGMLIVGVFLSALLLTTSYSSLQAADADDFFEATTVRADVFEEVPLGDNLDRMSFLAANGAILSLILGLSPGQRRWRYMWLGSSLICLIGTLLPMSRSGVLIVSVASFVVLLMNKAMARRQLVGLLVIVVVFIVLVPDAVVARLQFGQLEHNGSVEGRTRVYRAIVTHLPEVWAYGIGAGNFAGAWGRLSDFWAGDKIIPAHNCFVQVMLYWGMGAVWALIGVVVVAYRCLPWRRYADTPGTCIYAIALSLFLWMMLIGELQNKEFALGLGLIAGAHCWRIFATEADGVRWSTSRS